MGSDGIKYQSLEPWIWYQPKYLFSFIILGKSISRLKIILTDHSGFESNFDQFISTLKLKKKNLKNVYFG